MTAPLERLTAALADRYRVERELGQGGMATVFLAHDLRHHRQVALKVLRPELAAVIGAERFLHEITTTANLQHPHILPLHDSGTVDGTVFYVMPFVEGETLRHRLGREKQLPIDDALRITREVASALDYAHRRGVIHRDIKPENILLHDGSALVADFGIALAASTAGATRMTETGMSLGTPHYMSPEQAMGERELTARSDVYALGCVLYEMLVGEPPFTGPTAQSIVAKVMTEEPRSVTGQRRTVPAHVDAALLTALEKLPADRFATAAAFAEALGQPSFTRSTTAVRYAAPPSAVRWKRIAIGLGAVGVLLAAALVASAWSRAEPDSVPRPVVRFEVPIPDSLSVSAVVLSPDGARLLVLTESRPWMYTFADMRLAPLDIPGLRGYTTTVDFSPDGAWLAFVERRTLKLAPAGGGSVRTLIDSTSTVRWGDDGFLYVNRPIRSRTRIGRLPAEGGAIEYLFEAEDSTADVNGFPLPGGRTLVIGTERLDPRRVELSLLDVRTRRLRPLPSPVPDGFPMAYSPSGHLLLYGNDALHAVPFDLKKHAFTGPPVPFLSGIPLSTSLGGGMFAHTMTPAEGPVLLDRRGVRRELPGAIAPNTWAFQISVSPDGKAFALFRYETPADRWDVYVYRLPAGPLTRVSPDSATISSGPKWSPDGSSIWFMITNKDRGSVYRTAADGSTPVEPLLARPGSIQALSPLPDGRRVVIDERGRGLELVSLDKPDSVVTLVEERVQPQRPAVSRDGRWLAYSAMDLGRREVFVRAVDGGSARWKVSRNGGDHAVWSWSGRELFFLTEDSLHAARLGAGPGFQVEDVQAVIRLTPSVGSGTRNGFDVLPGDSLFITIATARNEQSRIVVTANFYEQLRALTAPRRAGQAR